MKPLDQIEPTDPLLGRRILVHNVRFVGLPWLGVIAGFLFWNDLHPTAPVIALGLILWFVSMIGVTVGFHRLCTHRAFKCGPFMTRALVAAGSLAGNFPVIPWCSIHRKHHQASDVQGDPHSPNLQGPGVRGLLRGLWQTQVGWMKGGPLPNPTIYVRDLMANGDVMWGNRNYGRILVAGLVIPGLVVQAFSPGWQSFLSAVIWAGFFRLVVVQHFIFSVNSICHRFGARPHATKDNSRNNLLVALLTLGEGWHNNHHRFPASAYLGLRWWQIDPGAWFIAGLARLGLAWDVVDPRKHASLHEN